jgi:hypothetical protein
MLHGGGNFEKESHTMHKKFEIGKWKKYIIKSN